MSQDLYIAEVPELTKAGKKCQGVFANKDFKAGEIIREFSGTSYSLFDTFQINKLILAGIITEDDPLPVGEYEYVILDPESAKFNHSCNPNAGIRGKMTLIAIKDIKKGEQITYDYSTTVHPNDYSNAVYPRSPEHIWSMECACGEASCRGLIQNILTIPASQLDFYLQAKAIPDFLVPVIKQNKH
jgi:hypothetical protein